MDEKYIKDLAEFFGISEEEAEEAANEIYQSLSSLLNDPSFFVNIVYKYLDNFIQYIDTANTKFGSDRKDYILGKIDFLSLLLNRQSTSNQLALDLIENEKERIKEQHDFWKKELTKLPEGNSKLRELDAEFKEKETTRILNSVRREVKFRLAYNLGTRLKQAKEEFISALYMFQNIREEVSSSSAAEIQEDIISTSKKLKEEIKTDDVKLIDDFLSDHNLVDDKKISDDTFDNQGSYQVEYSASYFNETSYNFFNYLIEKYVGRQDISKNARGIKRKLSYTWHFMKERNNYEKDFSFTMTKNEFKEMIWKHFNIELKNLDKEDSYFNSHYYILRRHLQSFKGK